MKLDLNHALDLLEIVREHLSRRYDELDDSFERDYVNDNIQRLDTAMRAIELELEKKSN